VASISSSEARAALPEVLDRVLAGEEVTITRHGQPVAVVIRPDALRSRRAGGAATAAATVGDALKKGRGMPLSAIPGLSPARADVLIAELQAGRNDS